MERNAHANDPRSSFEAAASVAESAASLRDVVLDYLRRVGPSAPEEIAFMMGIDRVSIARRCSDLKRDGLIVVHEEMGWTNMTGRRADILAAVPA